MAIEQLKYPKGKVAIEGGELQDYTNGDGSIDDGCKTVSTHRNGGMASGVVYGPKSAKFTFTSVISSEGFERDYLGKHSREESVEARFKFPGGKVLTINGGYTGLSWKDSTDGTVEFTVTVTGGYSLSG
jgi:hypothetical protein